MVTQALQEQLSFDDPMKMSNLGRITFMSEKITKIVPLMENGYIEPIDDEMMKKIFGDMYDVFIYCQHDWA